MPRQNGRHFPDDIFKSIFLNIWMIKISLKYVPLGAINDILALIQIMTWRQPGASHCLNQWWLIYWCIYEQMKHRSSSSLVLCIGTTVDSITNGRWREKRFNIIEARPHILTNVWRIHRWVMSIICLTLIVWYLSYCMDTDTLIPRMVVLMIATSCLNKQLHINGYEKQTGITFTKVLMQMPIYHSMLHIMLFGRINVIESWILIIWKTFPCHGIIMVHTDVTLGGPNPYYYIPRKYMCLHFESIYGSGHETTAVLLPGFAINW